MFVRFRYRSHLPDSNNSSSDDDADDDTDDNEDDTEDGDNNANTDNAIHVVYIHSPS